MGTQELLERALESFVGSYDITRNAQVSNRQVEALAEFKAMNSKYMLSKKWVVWEANAFEQCVFVTADKLTAEMVKDWFNFLTKEAEPELVHPGEKYPPEGHMYTYLTCVFICNEMDGEAEKAVREAKFSLNYMMSVRGWCTGRALAVSTEADKVVVNKAAGKEMKQHFVNLLHPEKIRRQTGLGKVIRRLLRK